MLHALHGAFGTTKRPVRPVTWAIANTTEPFGTTIINDVAYGANKYIAVGNSGKMASSIDGITWTTINTVFGTTAIYVVVYKNNLWIAAGGSGKLATSTDGITWTLRTSSFGTAPILSIDYGNNIYVAVGGSGKLATSTNATSWTQRTSSFGTTYIYKIAYGDNRWVAVGDLGKLASSTTGTSWTQRVSGFLSTLRLRSVITSKTGLSIAAGDNGTMSMSINGTTWTASTDLSFANTTISALAADDKYGILAAGFIGKLGFATATSMHTISNFTQITPIVSTTLNAAVYSVNDKYVAVGTNGVILYSA